MTEEEAKTKWCPFARGINENGGNRVAYGSAGDGPVEEDYTQDAAMKFPCIGSACMAWRWDGVLSGGKRHTSPEAVFAAQNPTLPASAGGMNADDVPLGFCGLVHTTTIQRIRNGKAWSSVPSPEQKGYEQ